MQTILPLSDTIEPFNMEFDQTNSITFENDSNTSFLCSTKTPQHETNHPIIHLLYGWVLV